MNKKNFLPIIFLSLLFTSCWIYPDYKEYEIIDGVYFFDDYETMKAVIIPMINKSFTAWHWNGKEFDEKYDKYFGNVEVNEEDLSTLSSSDFNYAVRNERTSKNKIQPIKSINIANEYFWITTKEDGAVVFYQN